MEHWTMGNEVLSAWRISPKNSLENDLGDLPTLIISVDVDGNAAGVISGAAKARPVREAAFPVAAV